MKYLSFLLLLFFVAENASAEKRYIIDELRVPLRKTACGRCAIIHGGLKSGTELTLIKKIRPDGEKEDWSHVQTQSGKTGWLPSQYLANQQVAKYRIKTVEANLAKQQQQNKALKQQLAEAKQRFDQLQGQASEVTASNSSINRELTELKEISGSAIALQKQNQELLKRNKMLQTDNDILSATNEQLRNKDSQNWFFYGGIAVVLGALLTVLLPQLTRRKKFSEWG